MESDYYLHNYHVKAGKGSVYSMKTYEQSFGVDWSDDAESDGANDQESVVSATSYYGSKPNRTPAPRPLAHQRNISMESATSACRRDGESKRVLRVRHRCKAQNDALSNWWKVALQSNIKQRMWMRIGRNTAEPLPPRYDRIYQPHKLGQFDRFFSRAWTTPVRRSHAAQHTEGLEDGDTVEFTRVVSNKLEPSSISSLKSDTAPSDAGMSLGEFGANYGYESRFESSLPLYVAQHVGQVEPTSEGPPEEYLRYVSPSGTGHTGPASFKKETVQEFEDCLHEFTLQADDVAGIRELAISAHLGERILAGPYSGLAKSQSAIEAATAIHEQFNAFESGPVGGRRLVEKELMRRGLDTDGMRESVAAGLRDLSFAKRQYAEIVDGPISGCRRSDLTTARSLQLYASEFDTTTRLSTTDLIYLRNPDRTDVRRQPRKAIQTHQPTAFAKKAARLGIATSPNGDASVTNIPPLYPSERVNTVPVSFEQINEDLFSRRDNKFMVFNGAAVRSWKGTQPLTKISHTENILLSTL